jgi:Domain of Unknown Function (DUF1206)
MSSATSHVKASASRAADSKPLEYLARGGFICYGVIHLLLAWLTLQVAFAHSGKEGDQTGALQSLAGNSFGKVLLVVIVIGMVSLAIWQAFQAAIGESGLQDKEAIAERVLSGVRAIIYLWLAWTALKAVTGANSSSAANSQNKSSSVMSSTGGRWLIGLIGLVVIGVGIALIYNGLSKRFERRLNTQQMKPSVRKSTRRLGQSGYTAKGVAYGIAGVLVVMAAVTYDPNKARGLDAALKTLAGHSYGIWLLALIAIGFAAFGVFCFSQAKYRKV